MYINQWLEPDFITFKQNFGAWNNINGSSAIYTCFAQIQEIGLQCIECFHQVSLLECEWEGIRGPESNLVYHRASEWRST